jgi:hypothetical protein
MSDSALSGQTRLTGWIRLRYVGAHPQTAGPRCQPAGPLGREEAGWAEPEIQPKSLRKLENPFSFSKLFYKLQTKLNSNQIWISMTSTRTIKYKSTSSHQEKYATTWMQQIIIYLNILLYRILFFSKIRVLQFNPNLALITNYDRTTLRVRGLSP